METLRKARSLGRFFLIWYSEQFAVPFWIVGHVHLHFEDYHALLETGASVVMNLMVAVGFFIAWKDYDREREVFTEEAKEIEKAPRRKDLESTGL